MQFIQAMRVPPSWLRALLATLVLAFGLNSVAHAEHEHSDASVQVVHATCGYCAIYQGFIDGPSHSAYVRTNASAIPAPTSSGITVTSVEIVTSARPRAPPFN